MSGIKIYEYPDIVLCRAFKLDEHLGIALKSDFVICGEKNPSRMENHTRCMLSFTVDLIQDRKEP